MTKYDLWEIGEQDHFVRLLNATPAPKNKEEREKRILDYHQELSDSIPSHVESIAELKRLIHEWIDRKIAQVSPSQGGTGH